MEVDDDKNCKVYNIKRENALRFILTDNTSVSIKLLGGFAEILGTELEKDKMYTIPSPASISLFSWQGCTVKFYGTASKIHLENQSSMFIPAYMHACLEERRIRAESEKTRGPVSLVIGTKDTGKSSFCRILLNYAARQGRSPLYIDLDVNQNSSSLPGSVSMLLVEKPCDVTEGFNHRALSVYPFGYADPSRNVALYLLLIKELGEKLKNLMGKANDNTQFSGVIIDTYGWVTSEGYFMNKLAATAFDVDVVFVINDKKLCLKLKKDLPPKVKVVLVPKTEANKRRKGFRSRNQDNCIYDYFYGLKRQLNPFTFKVRFSEIEIYKIMHVLNISSLQNVSFKDIKILKVPFERDLLYHILSLSYSDTADENLVKSNIIGFVCVVDVCLDKKFVKLLSPQPYPLPSRILIVGEVKLK